MSREPKFEPHEYATAVAKSESVASDGQLLYNWTGTHWSAVEPSLGDRQAYAWIVKHRRIHATPANARAAHKAAIMWAPALQAACAGIVIPCQNGYLTVNDTGALLFGPANRALGLQYVLGCEYDPAAPTPEKWLAFLDQVLPDKEVQARLQEYYGYTLTAEAEHQIAHLWLGGGANGKGVASSVLQALHGKVAAIDLTDLGGFSLSGAIGASLLVCDEIPKKVDEQPLKALLGGGMVRVDRKYQEPLSVKLKGKLLVLGNHLPNVTDQSNGWWRRWDIVPFSVTIPPEKRDPKLSQKIVKDELQGVLNWALDGLVRLLRRGGFDPVMPHAMAQVLRTAKSETNSVLAWWEENEIHLTRDITTPKAKVYQHYADWCKASGRGALGANHFWSRVRDLVHADLRETRARTSTQRYLTCNVWLPMSTWH